jgi:hypothetical protein
MGSRTRDDGVRELCGPSGGYFSGSELIGVGHDRFFAVIFGVTSVAFDEDRRLSGAGYGGCFRHPPFPSRLRRNYFSTSFIEICHGKKYFDLNDFRFEGFRCRLGR